MPAEEYTGEVLPFGQPGAKPKAAEYTGEVLPLDAPARPPLAKTPYPEAGPIRAAAPKPAPKQGSLAKFWDALTDENFTEMIQRSLPAHLYQGIGRVYDEAIQAKLPAELQRQPAPEGFRWSTSEELKETGQTLRKDVPPQKVGEALRKIKDYAVANPEATVAEFVKGAAIDPWLIAPIFSSTTGSTKLASFVARLGTVAERSARIAGNAAELAIKGGAVAGGMSAAEQFSKGVYDSGELAANTLIGGAMFGAIGAVRGMFSPAELASGRIPKSKAEDLLAAWAEKDPNIAKAVDAGELTVADIQRKAFLELEADKVLNARAKADQLMQRGASKAEVEAVIKRDKLVGEELDKIRKRREDVAASRLGTVLQGEVLPPKEQGAPPVRPARPPADIVDMQPPTPRLEAPKDAGLPPRRAPKGQRGAVDVTVFDDLTGPNAKDSALSPLIAAAPYTLKTLDRLPQNRFVFTVEQIKNEMKRQDVTDAERGVLTAALEGAKDGKISATDLMRGVKVATGDFELEAKQTAQYANYGLEGIDRVLAPDEIDGAPWIPDDATPAQEAALRAQHAEGVQVRELAAPPATTTLYRLPDHMPMSDANHFNDAQLFGWTRSFQENGVRHVVEIQSDLAQHAKGGVKPEEIDALLKEAQQISEGLNDIAQQTNTFRSLFKTDDTETWRKSVSSKIGGLNPQARTALGRSLERLWNSRDAEAGIRETLDLLETGPVTQRLRGQIVNAFEQAKRDLSVRADEIRTKLDATAIDSQLAPVLKNWPKRLVREELAQAAAAGEKTVRFATADTVAKVEGWHDAQGPWGSNDPNVPRFSPEHQAIYDRYNRDITKFLKQLGGTEVTDSAGHTWIEVPVPRRGPVQMFGRADENLVATLGAAGAGAALGYFLDREPGDSGAGGAVLGAIASIGAANIGSIAKGGGAALDRGLGLLSTRIRNISEPLLHRAREFERRTLASTHQRIAQADTFLTGLEKLKNPELERAIKTNDAARIKALMPAELAPEWAKVRATLDEVGKELQKYDRLTNLREGYFPRIVKDRDGLLEALGVAEKSKIEQLLRREEAISIKAGNGPLDIAQQSAVINKYLQERVGGDRPGFTKQRKLAEITEALDPFYASNTEALHSYLASATAAIERSKFFGRDLVTKDLDGRQVVDLNSSIGRVVAREMDAGRINPAQADELAEMLRARFESRAANPLVQDLKNLANTGLLGNVISAGTQLGDLGTSVYMQGLRPSLEAVARSLVGKQRVSMKDFGLVDHISEEFVSTRPTARALNTVFKYSGFSAVDAFGKNTLLNSALSKYQRLAQTPKGELTIAKKYSAMFSDDYPKLLEELRSKTVGEQTRALLFSELSDAQPISKLEVPQKYLEMPNGRIIYMLKTFMLKQADIVRRDSYNEFRKGNRAAALGNLGKFALALGISGAATQTVKDWLLGKPFDFESADIPLNFLKTFGLSEYVLDKAKQGKPVEALLGTATPPYKMMDDIIRQDPKAARYIPIVGPLIYAHELGGADKAIAKGEGPEARAAKERLRRAKERQKLEQRGARP